MLKRLHARHEVHYLTLEDPENAVGPLRAHEYCQRHVAVPHRAARKGSLGFWLDLMRGLAGPLPVAIARWQNEAMRTKANELIQSENYDAIVCDFLAPAASLDHWSRMVLFQHNVEFLIWRRHAECAPTFLHRWYLQRQANSMKNFEDSASKHFQRVVCVSAEDARLTGRLYGREDAAWVPTGVDTNYFSQPLETSGPSSDLIFLGSMDWLPNIDGATWLAAEILPRIWARRPETTVALVGRRPAKQIARLAQDRRIRVSGTVEDVRPWLRGARISIVPLRIGGGTRLKIYEAMAAGIPVISTATGAEGLEVTPGEDIVVAETPGDFASRCLSLLEDDGLRRDLARQALARVRARHDWDIVTRRFESYLID
jgi:glycosyltransferase involved in cell wall biosynthesis